MRSSRGERLLRPAFLLAVPLFVRLACLLELRGDPFFQLLVVDARTYHDTATAMAAGTFRLEGPFWQPPFYPFFLSVLYRIAGPSPMAARLVQAILGSLSALLAFRLGGRIGGRGAAWIAWGVLALGAPFIYFDLQILGASLATFLLSCAIDRALAWSDARRGRDLVLAGLSLGLASITVATSLVLVPVFAVWAWRTGRQGGLERSGSGRARAPGVAGLRGALVLLGCASLPVFAVTAINLSASGQPVLISYNGGINFWIGNNPEYERTVAIRPGRAWQALAAEPVAAGVRTEAGTSAWFLRRSWSWMAARPGEWAALLLRKARLFLRGDEIARNQEIYPFRESSWILRLLLWIHGIAFPGGLLVPLGLAGMVWALRAPPGRPTSGVGLPAAVFLAYSAGVVAFFVASRYRLPVLPILAAFAGAALARGGAALGARRARELLLPSATAVVFLVVANAGLPAMPRAFTSDSYSDMGTSHFERGRFDEAAAWYERALELDPANAEAAHNLGAIWLKRGRAEQAEPLFRHVLASWPGDAKALVNLGNVFLQRGEPYRAGRYFLEVARRDPADPDASRNLRLAEEMALRLERERTSADARAFLDQLERLLAHEPENEFLRERLRALRAGATPAVR